MSAPAEGGEVEFRRDEPVSSDESLFRSKDMQYVSLTMPFDSAFDTARELGNFGKFHIVDLNAGEVVPSKNVIAYKKRVADCVFYEKKLQALEQQMTEFKIAPPPPLPAVSDRKHTEKGDAVAIVKNNLEPIEDSIKRSIAVQTQINQLISTLIEKRHVFETCKSMNTARVEAKDDRDSSVDLIPQKDVELGERERKHSFSTSNTGLSAALISNDHHQPNGKFVLPKFRTVLTGVITSDKQTAFQRMLYRVSRGNAIAHFVDIAEPIPDPVKGEPVEKSVFSITIVVSELMERRIMKMCQLFQATLYKLPDDHRLVDAEVQKMRDELTEQQNLKRNTLFEIERVLQQLAGRQGEAAPIREWQWLLRCEKAVCDALMKGHFYLTMIAMEGWVPVEDMAGLDQAVKRAVAGTGNPPAFVEKPSKPLKAPGMPPTYFKTNKYTGIFQEIVNTYGIPRYQEVNPGLFTIATFPFLFGVMYGDIGHGICLTIFALLMIIKEESMLQSQREGKMSEMVRMVFTGRYMLFAMGLFGIYCGTIYNDCMSIPTALYGSGWTDAGEHSYVQTGVYPYGVDYQWYHMKNQLLFFNGLKMKMSVTIGVIHMTFGLSLSLFNHIYFGDKAAILLEFIPQLLFLLCIFGWMVFLIIYKLCIDWSTPGYNSPPLLIQVMIQMFLKAGSVDADKALFEGQAKVQQALLAIAFLSVPVMLVGKPLALTYGKKPHQPLAQDEHKAPIDPEHVHDHKDEKDEKHEDHDAGHGHAAGDHDDHSFGELMTHQGIHTIEYVLGTVSNTASYLRLWALSLAHSELAEVFWSKLIVEYGIYKKNPIMNFITVAVWAAMTIGVLLMMDVLECFLHALRLHWVEFQNKFYHADGYAFQPFNYHSSETD